jgi:GT2 family glycosyltransferase|tara:strand:- start:1162 stop:1902 length:741 start_codon:yes stop_codon:yes gene_type:complete
MKLTVAIPTYNNLQQLQWCVQSLFKHTSHDDLHVVIIDNGGKNEVENKLEYGNLPISILSPNKNLGWMGAINLALNTCNSSYFCMLNDDVVFPATASNFWQWLESHLLDSRIGAVGPCSNFVAGGQSLMCLDTPNVFSTDVLIGFCLMIKTQLFKNLGGLDESLPGGDDFDLSIRLLKAGHKMHVDKRSYLHHFGQQTGNRVHEGFWDSSRHQEVINNALIKKHGLSTWYETFLMGWSEPIFKDGQ